MPRRTNADEDQDFCEELPYMGLNIDLAKYYNILQITLIQKKYLIDRIWRHGQNIKLLKMLLTKKL